MTTCCTAPNHVLEAGSLGGRAAAANAPTCAAPGKQAYRLPVVTAVPLGSPQPAPTPTTHTLDFGALMKWALLYPKSQIFSRGSGKPWTICRGRASKGATHTHRAHDTHSIGLAQQGQGQRTLQPPTPAKASAVPQPPCQGAFPGVPCTATRHRHNQLLASPYIVPASLTLTHKQPPSPTHRPAPRRTCSSVFSSLMSLLTTPLLWQ